LKILIWSQYYWPEEFHINDVASRLVRCGDSVSVFTGKPNYPTGRFFEGYFGAGIVTEKRDGITIFRVPIFPRKTGIRNRAINYLSFFFSGLLFPYRVLKGHKFDVILAFGVSPLPGCLPALIYGKVTGVPCSVWVQDLWPESIVVSGLKVPRPLKFILSFPSWILFRYADQVLVQSRAFIRNVLSYNGVNRSRVHYHPNSYEIQHVAGEPLDGDWVYRLSRSFSVVFTGNIGSAQNCDLFLRAAEMLKDHSEICFFLIGEGSEHERVSNEVRTRCLPNVVLPGRISRSSIEEVFKAADILILSLTSADGVCETVPSKLQAYLSAGKPIILGGKGECARIILEAGCGFVCSPSDEKGFAESILKVYSLDASQRNVMGERGRSYFVEHFSSDKLLQQLRAHLSQIIPAPLFSEALE